MVHMLKPIRCKKGHTNLSLTLDVNECGCHHNGDPCIVINCRDCFTEALKNNTLTNIGKIYIPIGKHTMEELDKFTK